MTNRQANIQAAKWLLLFLAALACLAAATPLIEAAQNLGLEALGRAIDSHPQLWLYSIACGVILVVALTYFLYARPRNPLVLTKHDWDELYLGRQGSKATSFEKNWHRMMDMPGLRDSMLRQSRLNAQDRAELDRWEEGRQKRSAEMLQYRLVDLPGYESWASQYEKLGDLIPDLEPVMNLKLVF